MKKMKFKFPKISFKGTKKSRNEIAIIAGAITFGISTFVMGYQTPKAIKLLEEEKKKTESKKLPVKTEAKILAKCFAAPFIFAAGSLTMVITGTSSNYKKNKALEQLALSSDAALKTYRAQVKESLGEEKEKEISRAVSAKRMTCVENNIDNSEYDLDGLYVFEDSYTGQRIKTTKRKIDTAALNVNKLMRDECCASMNMFYEEVGWNRVTAGERLCWNIDDGYFNPVYSPYIDELGRVIILVEYDKEPQYDYYS